MFDDRLSHYLSDMPSHLRILFPFLTLVVRLGVGFEAFRSRFWTGAQVLAVEGRVSGACDCLDFPSRRATRKAWAMPSAAVATTESDVSSGARSGLIPLASAAVRPHW